MRKNNPLSAKTRLNKLAWLLDNAIPIPGLNFRIGLDGLIGLIPFVGDAFGTLMSSYILAEAARLQVPKTVLFRMGFNILIDSVIGIIPFIGDLSDFAWKANLRNVRLLENYVDNPRRTGRSSRWLAVVFIIVIIAVVILIAVLSVWLLQAVWSAITG
jgi:hypothetical protein